MLIFNGFGMGEEAPAKAPADRNSAANPNDRVKVLSDLAILGFFHRASVEFKSTLKPGVRMAAEGFVHIRYRKTPALKIRTGVAVGQRRRITLQGIGELLYMNKRKPKLDF
jgi:hypothetical protein